jgi:hypothetical protein
MPKRPRKRKPKIEYQSFYFAIERSWPRYSFSLESRKFSDRLYHEHLELVVRGSCLSPTKFRGLQCEMTFLGERKMDEQEVDPREPDRLPLCIGMLDIRKEQAKFLGSLPQDVLWPLENAIGRKTIRIIDFFGEKLTRGSSRIRRVHFDPTYDTDDMID